jgi:hypothetical protein
MEPAIHDVRTDLTTACDRHEKAAAGMNRGGPTHYSRGHVIRAIVQILSARAMP